MTAQRRGAGTTGSETEGPTVAEGGPGGRTVAEGEPEKRTASRRAPMRAAPKGEPGKPGGQGKLDVPGKPGTGRREPGRTGTAKADPGKAETAKSQETKTRLLEGALRVLTEQGIAKTSARTVAAAAGVNQALVFYHFGSVDELLAATCRYGAEQAVARHRARMAAVGSLSELLTAGREIHEQERAEGHVALLGQMLAGASTHPGLGPATTAGLDLWIAEIEQVLRRVLTKTPFGEFTDPAGLARAVAASFVGIELYEGVDRTGAHAALDALEQLGALVTALENLSPVAQRAVRHHLRRTVRH